MRANKTIDELTALRDEAVARRRRRRRVGLTLLVVLCVVLAGAAGWLGWNFWQLKDQMARATADQPTALVAKVAGLIDLPKDETPTIATVQDETKLKDQAFFAQAQNGDKLLIYAQAKKAIIYRPGDHKVINVGPLAITGEHK